MTAGVCLSLVPMLCCLVKIAHGFGDPIECNKTNEFWSCGGACHDSCQTRYGVENPCPYINIVCNSICYCIPGYVKDGKNINEDVISGGGKCIPEWTCEGQRRCLGENEVFRDNGNPCESNCALLGQPCPIVDRKARPGCYCDTGYARNEWDRCIPKEECPRARCFQLNEVHTSRPCDKVCGMLEGCASGASAPVEGCFCRTGYVRQIGGRGKPSVCIPEWQCYQKNKLED